LRKIRSPWRETVLQGDRLRLRGGEVNENKEQILVCLSHEEARILKLAMITLEKNGYTIRKKDRL